MKLLCTLFFSFSLLLPASHAADWPQFRGPTGQGHAVGAAPTQWSENENIAWKTPLPGRGWSSPVVLGDQIWMTTAIESAASPEELAAKDTGPLSPKAATLASSVSLRALCVDRETGELIHDLEVLRPETIDAIHSLNSYASPTPVIEPGRLYCHFGTYGNACVDTKTGEVLWRRVLPLEHYVGPGSSPVLYDDLLVLTYDGANEQFVTALDKATGETVWRQERPPIRAENPDVRKSYCTPLVFRAAGRDQLGVTGAQWFVSYDPRSGDEIWRVEHGDGFSVVPRPVADEGVVYFASGFTRPEMIAVRADGSGDVTETHILGRSSRQAPTQPSPLLVEDRLFTVSDRGVGICLDRSLDGLLWKKRLGGNYSASPLAVNGSVYFFSREGVTTIVDNRGPEPKIAGTNKLEGRIMATPAVIDGRIYLRTATHLYCIAE